MTAAEKIPLVSVEEYQELELASDVRHEYLGGYLYAMAVAKTVHNRLAGAFYGMLYNQLRGQPCEPFNSDMKVRIKRPNHTRFYYSDGMIVCTPNGPDDSFQDNPVVIAEVISESTRRIDEGEKRDFYLSLPSLSVYLLIETDKPCVFAYRRTGDGADVGSFQTEQYRGLEAIVPLEKISAELPLRELYERVEFKPQAEAS